MARRGDIDARSDEQLVALCNDGSAREAAVAFDALYLRHKDFVLRVALRFTRDPSTALDVLQETFRYLLEKFPPTGDGLTLTARLTTLLYPVAKNLAISDVRRADRLDNADGPDPDELPAPAAPASEPGEWSRLLAGLSADRREIVLLRFVDDLSLNEIADTLKIPLGTAKSRLHLAIRDLRESPETRNFLKP